MPSGIASSDRKLLLVGGALILLFLFASVIMTPPRELAESPIPSTYSPQSAGAEAAYRLLGKLHYPVRRWESPPSELDEPQNTLLILAEPIQPASEKEKKALAEFVQKGGHVLFTGASIREYFPGVELSRERPDPTWKSFPPKIPTRITRGTQQITLQPQAFWKAPTANQLELFGDSGNPVVVSWSLGEGNILWWAASTPLSNAGITRDDNLTLFLNAVGNWNQDGPYKIYWDEYFHGQRSSILSYVGKTSLAWSGLQIAILAIAVLFTFSRRSGPVYVPAEASRLSPLEFVESLGGLYERAGAASSAISISMMRLRSLLTRQLGLPTNTYNAELAQAATSRLGWKDSGLGETLARAEAARNATGVSSREALELVQNLEKFTARLDVRSQVRREKT